MLRWLTGAAAMALLLWEPQAAAEAARNALALWYRQVAPALFPFMALMPLLTCPEGLQFYERCFGGLMGLIGLPGASASALAVGLLAGSPAGCAAARRVSSGMNRSQLTRLAAACGGLSPGFLISGVGAGLLGDAQLGLVLLRSHIAAALLVLALPGGRDAEPVPPPEDDAAGSAVSSILGVAGYMALFAALAGAIRPLAGAVAGDVLLSVMDVTSGAALIAALPLPMIQKMLLLSALTAFGGACVCAQNLRALAGAGLNSAHFLLRRALTAALAAFLTAAQLQYNWKIPVNPSPDALKCAALCAVLLSIPAIWRWKKYIFNN